MGTELTETNSAIILNDNAWEKLPLQIPVPVTDRKVMYGKVSGMSRLEPDKRNGWTQVSSADRLEVRSVSRMRF